MEKLQGFFFLLLLLLLLLRAWCEEFEKKEQLTLKNTIGHSLMMSESILLWREELGAMSSP